MIKAINEIGLRKFARFIILTFYTAVYDHALFSPLRICLLRFAGAKIGSNTILYNVKFFNFYHQGFSNLRIGDDCFLGNEVMVDLADKVVLKDFVTLSNRSLVLTHTNVGFKDHPLQNTLPKRSKQVIIESGSFIGASALIMPGLTIGEKAIVGAGAIVTKNVFPKSIVVGNPAKEIKKIHE